MKICIRCEYIKKKGYSTNFINGWSCSSPSLSTTSFYASTSSVHVQTVLFALVIEGDMRLALSHAFFKIEKKGSQEYQFIGEIGVEADSSAPDMHVRTGIMGRDTK
mmetsp:Transcript_18386/g.27920  ORF Transcript_18386/g.27920 Transcript_18386/m.27920 type:complete len:106 (+) Transcript_18386:2067-2384(+)